MRGAAWVVAITFVAGAAVYLLVARRGRDDGRRLRADLTSALEHGTFADLGRAQALGRRLVVSNARDRQAAAQLAFTDAMLAVDYGLETAREAEEALAGAHADDAGTADDSTVGLALAARALIRLRAGELDAAVRTAASAVALAPDLPYPLYALGRARARASDLAGAERALEGAIVQAPGFTAARVAWAEARLDLGDPKNARIGLAALGPATRDPRAVLLGDELEAALDLPPSGALDAACRPERWTPAAIVTGCILSRAGRARRAGSRADARAQVEAAGRIVPDEPRLLARAALALAQLGAVDQGAALLARARRLASPRLLALARAEAAVALGRGRSPAPADAARPFSPEARLLSARIALASGGVAALDAALTTLGPAARDSDAGLRTLSRLVSHPRDAEGGDRDPLRAYVDGLAADLAGDPARAADRLRHALSGHGDACRAAGEYVGALRTLKQRPSLDLFVPLRHENSGCVNLLRR
jgi:tetratricopeptide (TPR) repeat protein